ncbi:MAG: TorD/DmsD family molecular chaperone [Burkholderiales bacterium]
MMTATIEADNRVPPVPGETAEEMQARAALYGLLAHLFLAAPARELLDRIAASSTLISGESLPLQAAWQELCAAARIADPARVREEFDSVFVGPGRPEVSLYASSYMSGTRRGHLLAELRDDLARAGYSRSAASSEYEDHLSALCEVMRGMVGEEQLDAAAFDAQREFFERYLAPWYAALCDAINQSGRTVFFRPVARFASAFFVNESEYFELA